MGRYLIIAILFVTQLSFSQVKLNQIEKGANNTQMPVTRGIQNTMVYRNIESFLVDTIGLLNECCYDSIYRHLDSIRLRDGAGFVILPDTSSTNEIELPSQTGNSGKYLTTNGTSPSWATVPSGEATTVGDTPTVDLTLTGTQITAKADTSYLATKYDLTLIGGGMDSTFNGNRAISRIYQVGTNTGANTLREMFEWMYIGNYTQPTLTFNSVSPTLVEVGSSTAYTLTGSTSNPCNYTLANGALSAPATHSFGSAVSFSKSYTHTPTSHTTTTITASQDWTMTTTSCVSGSPTSGTKTASRTITNAYPIFYGMSATEYTSGAVPYTTFTKRVVDPSASSSITALTMTGTNQYMYILIPTITGDYTVTSIIDHNGFNVTSSFTAYDVTVTSTGLTNNWTQNYKLYKLNNLTTASGFNYIYNR